MQTGTGHIRIGVLGRTTLESGTSAVPLSPAQRRLLAALVLEGRAGATPERLVAAVWGDQPPRSARPSLHNQLTRLRRHLHPDTITWDDRRYRLADGHADLDVQRFTRLCAEAGISEEAGDAATVLRRTDEALGVWRGEPFEDITVEYEGVEQERVRFGELRAAAEDARARALLATGQLPMAIAALQDLVVDGPHREQRWSALMVALTRAGRRADALAAYASARRYFVGELGLEPPRQLEEIHLGVLRHELDTVDRRGQPPAATGGSSIVGRAEVVADIDRRLEDAVLVVVTGEAGIGKSCVLAEVAEHRQRRGRRTVVATCASNPWSALQPVVDLLSALRDEIGVLDPPAGPSVWQLLGRGPVGTPVTALGNDPGVLHEEVADALDRVAQTTRGLTLVLDDAHRGGPTTHRLLRAALDRSPALHLVAATRQVADLPPTAFDGADVVSVPPLGREACTRIVHRHVTDEADATDLIDWLEDLTGGNALFVTALLEDLERRGLLTPGSDGRIPPPTTLGIPRRLAETAELAIGVLGLKARRALDVAAVLDEPVELPTLAEFVDPRDIDEAITAGLILHTTPTTSVFRHELIRRVAYDLIPTGRRIELHHAAAEVGRQQGVAAPQIAAHAVAAASLDPAGALHAAREAGEAALRALAYEEAASWFDQAVEVAPEGYDDLELLHLQVQAADALRLAGVAGHAERLLDAAERAVDREDEALRLRAVLAALRLGETGEPGHLQQRAAALAEVALEREADPASHAAISASASLVHSLSGEPDRCRQLFRDALAALEDDDPITAIQVLPYAYLGLAHIDDLEMREQAATRLCHDAALLDDAVGLWEGNHLTFTVALQRGDGPGLRRAHTSMCALRDRVGDAGRRWSTAYQQAALAHLDGDLEGAERAAEEALVVGSGVAASRAFSAYAGQLLELRRQADRLDELVPVIEQLVDQQQTLPAWRAAASLVLATTAPERSAELFDSLADGGRFAAVPRDFSWTASMLALLRGAALREDAGRAQAAAVVLAPYADLVSWQGTCTYGPVASALAEAAALAGDRTAARRYATTAARLAESLAAPRYGAEAEAVLRT